MAIVTVIAACSPTGASESASKTTVESSATTTEAAPTTVAQTSTTPWTETPSTYSGADDDLDCLDFWSEEFVMSVVPGYAYTETSADGTTCSFLSGTNSIGVSFRDGNQSLYEQAKASAAITADSAEDLTTECDAAWFANITLTIAEGLSNGQGRIFNATMIGPEDPQAVAAELLSVACSGPQIGD